MPPLAAYSRFLTETNAYEVESDAVSQARRPCAHVYVPASSHSLHSGPLYSSKFRMSDQLHETSYQLHRSFVPGHHQFSSTRWLTFFAIPSTTTPAKRKSCANSSRTEQEKMLPHGRPKTSLSCSFKALTGRRSFHFVSQISSQRTPSQEKAVRHTMLQAEG